MTSGRRALISVSDKRGIVELARDLVAAGFEIISTGGTAGVLSGAGIPVTEAAEVTGFPEILGGRVKTLHPHIHGAILARLDREDQVEELDRRGIIPFELVVVNLYPFEETISREGVTVAEAVENIDIGGPTMVRAAAKNHAHVAIVVNPGRYGDLVEEIKAKGRLSPETRRNLAAEAFAHTAAYDAMIASYFNDLPDVISDLYPRSLSLPMSREQILRYGENPQQSAAFYAKPGQKSGLAAARQLQGKELSFNNLNDLNAAWELVKEFAKPTAVAVKHANPCGVGSAVTPADAYRLAFDADPVSIFGGVLALNRPVDGDAAAEMVKIFLEVIAAPHFTEEALQILAAKKDVRLLLMPPDTDPNDSYDLRKVAGGFLIQSIDREAVDVSRGEVVTGRKPTPEEWRDLNFAQTVVKHIRSNAIVLAKNEQTVGVGAGQMSRIGAARIALAQAGGKASASVLGSDAFFPFPDTVEEAAKAGISAIVQPGGSLKDQESVEVCNRYNIAMVLTGRRYFKH
ncbi:MAG: bifunctional phosphoribosylaminoimidazolecarboxamide formyltransferase/IMP cyclohydrolase [Firmicutes bacterium]|nr:bifunctional phosphoribosylaminoimidazolecarboxamide formyltransferase/IMP cyclohydrolase [Bacillota bacterium]